MINGKQITFPRYCVLHVNTAAVHSLSDHESLIPILLMLYSLHPHRVAAAAGLLHLCVS